MTINNSDVKNKLYLSLKESFSNGYVDISNGYQDNIHVVIVSREFDDLYESEKLNLFYEKLKDFSEEDFRIMYDIMLQNIFIESENLDGKIKSVCLTYDFLHEEELLYKLPEMLVEFFEFNFKLFTRAAELTLIPQSAA